MPSLPEGRAVVVTSLASSPLEGIDTLRIDAQPAPSPGPGEALVAVKAAAVGWVDLLMTSGQYQHVPEPPYTPGLEYAGEVVAVGEGVPASMLGAEVLADGLLTGPRSLGGHRRYGGFASYALAPASALLPRPEPLSLDEAACLLGGYETAYHALVHRARLGEGESVLVLGATGSTGLAAVQLAKLLGAKVIAAGRSKAKLDEVRAAGADEVIVTVDDAGAPRKLRDELKALSGGEGVSVVYDPIGGELSVEALRGMAFGGRFVVVGWSATPLAARGGRDANQLPTNLILMKSIDVLGSPAAISVLRDPSVRTERLARILAWAREGKLRPVVSQRYELAQIREALRDKWESRSVGNLIVRP